MLIAKTLSLDGPVLLATMHLASEFVSEILLSR